MGTKVNMRDVGWMYHAPAADSGNREQVLAPPPSQIPLLGVPADPVDSEPRPMMFRSSDTPYIMLAKMGGRPDLLRFRECRPVGQDHSPKYSSNHTRCDWFYLEDQALQARLERESAKDEENGNGQVSYIPDYMVHEQAQCGQAGARRGGSESNVDRSPISEPRPFGYGIRQEKFKQIDSKKLKGRSKSTAALRGNSNKNDTEIENRPTQENQMINKEDNEETSMAKLLSFGYAIKTPAPACSKPTTGNDNCDKKNGNCQKETKACATKKKAGDPKKCNPK